MMPRSGSGSRTVLNALFFLIITLNDVQCLKDAINALQPMRANIQRFSNQLIEAIGPCSPRLICPVRYRDLSRDRTTGRPFDVASIAMAAYASFYQLNGVTIDDQGLEYAPGQDLGTFRIRDEPMVFFGLLPQTIEVLQTSFFLTVPNANINELPLTYANGGQNISDLSQLFQDNKLDQLYVIVHDWLSLSAEPLADDLTDALLTDAQYLHSAVLSVDWEIGSQSRGVDWAAIPINQVYAQAAVNSVLVGRELGLVLYYIWQARLVEPSNIHVIGHGLGAHVAHFAGEWFQRLEIIKLLLGNYARLGRITGLNPTALGFQGTIAREFDRERFIYLSKGDADFVDIIATNRVRSAVDRIPQFTDLLEGRVGFLDPTGDATFFVNSPLQLQPFCSSLPGIPFFFGCHQDSSLAYFFQSVRNRLLYREQRRLISVNCENYARKNDCVRKTVEEYGRSPACYGVMGIDAPGEPGRGQQFLDFNPNLFNFVAPDLQPVAAGPPVAPQQLNQLIKFQRYERSAQFDQLALRQVIDRFPNTEQVDNVQLHPEDRANCGLFRTFPGPPPARVISGDLSYRGQFPWSVCIFIMEFSYRSMTTTNATGHLVFRSQFPTYAVDKEHGADGDDVFGGVDRAWGDPQTRSARSSGCTGSLIDPQWVVTAAHCFLVSKNGVKMSLAFGGISCRRPVRSVTMTIEKRPRPEQNVFIPEPFVRSIVREADAYDRFFNGACTQERGFTAQSAARLGDIALIKLPEPLDIDDEATWPGSSSPKTALNTLCWRSAELFNYPHRKDLFVGATGFKGPDAPSTGELNWLKVQIVRRREFLDANKFYLGITLTNSIEGSFHAMNVEAAAPDNLTTWSGKMLIQGDSGGPYHWYVTQDNVQNDVVARARAVLVGVVGFGVGIEGTATVFGGVTRLRPGGALMTKAWMDWMVGIVGANTNPLQPNPKFDATFDPFYLNTTGDEGDYEQP